MWLCDALDNRYQTTLAKTGKEGEKKIEKRAHARSKIKGEDILMNQQLNYKHTFFLLLAS